MGGLFNPIATPVGGILEVPDGVHPSDRMPPPSIQDCNGKEVMGFWLDITSINDLSNGMRKFLPVLIPDLSNYNMTIASQ